MNDCKGACNTTYFPFNCLCNKTQGNNTLQNNSRLSQLVISEKINKTNSILFLNISTPCPKWCQKKMYNGLNDCVCPRRTNDKLNHEDQYVGLIFLAFFLSALLLYGLLIFIKRLMKNKIREEEIISDADQINIFENIHTNFDITIPDYNNNHISDNLSSHDSRNFYSNETYQRPSNGSGRCWRNVNGILLAARINDDSITDRSLLFYNNNRPNLGGSETEINLSSSENCYNINNLYVTNPPLYSEIEKTSFSSSPPRYEIISRNNNNCNICNSNDHNYENENNACNNSNINERNDTNNSIQSNNNPAIQNINNNNNVLINNYSQRINRDNLTLNQFRDGERVILQFRKKSL